MIINDFLGEIKDINFVDVGSSGGLEGDWKTIEKKINLFGFDPNVEECKRMSELPHNFKSVKYLPYAISGEIGEKKLHITESIYCYSLLHPNLNWLRRFSFSKLFEVKGEEVINVTTLDKVEELQGVDVDIIKTDTQGLELPILSNARNILDTAFYVETETGFVENYIGETTFSQIDEFMRSNDYLMFDMNINHRISRNNIFKDEKINKAQILWCEAIWLKDYVKISKKDNLKNLITREKALKALVICSLQSYIDYGYELAELFYDLKLLSKDEFEGLSIRENWRLLDIRNNRNTKGNKPLSAVINKMLRILPSGLRREIAKQAEISINQKHLLKF